MNLIQLQRIIKYSIVSIILLSFYSCTEKAGKQTNSTEKTMGLVVYDSIDLPDNELKMITDYNSNKGMFVGLFDKDIVGFSRKGEEFRFNHYGGSPEEYQFLFITMSNVKFIEDSLLAINSYNNLLHYDLNGAFVKSVLIDNSNNYLEKMILGKSSTDSNLYIFKGCNKEKTIPSGSPRFDYLNKGHFFTLSTDSNICKNYAPFEKDNLIAKHKKVYEYLSPQIAFNKELNCVDVLYSAQPKIYRYPLEDPQKFKSITLEPSTYSEMIFNDDMVYVKEHETDYIKNSLNSSYYRSLYSCGDTIITVYRPSIDKGIIEDEFKMKDYSYFNLKYKKHVFDYYIKGKKQSLDIESPRNLKIAYIGDSQHILCYDWEQEIVNEDNIPVVRYYFCKLAPVSEES